MHCNFIPLVLNTCNAKKKLHFCSPLLNIEKFILQETSQNFMEYMSLKMLPKKQFWNIRKISTHRVQNPMKKIEIDEHFMSYYSVKRISIKIFHQKCFYFLES